MPPPLRVRLRRLRRMLVMPWSSDSSLPRNEIWRPARYLVQGCLEKWEDRRSDKPLFGFVAAREEEKRFLLVSSGEEQRRCLFVPFMTLPCLRSSYLSGFF